MKSKNIISIINVYSSSSHQGRKCPNELKKLYKNLDTLYKEFDKVPSSIAMLTGAFNSKVRRGTGSKSSIGQWSRGRRNQNGTNLVEFFEKNGKFITNSCFQHPAKHITAWSQRRTSPVTSNKL